MSNHDKLGGDDAGQYGAASWHEVFAALKELLAANISMGALYHLVCKQAAAIRRASSAPRPLVNALILRLSRAQCKSIRSGLFKFFVADGDFDAARKYLPKPGTEDVSEYYPLMIWSLKMRKQALADRIYAACSEHYPEVDYGKSLKNNPYVIFQLASAAARYESAGGQMSDAVESWKLVPASGPDFVEATANIVSARLVEALLATSRGLDRLQEKQAVTSSGESAPASQDADWQLDATIEWLDAIVHVLLGLLTPSDLETFRIELLDDDEATEGGGL